MREAEFFTVAELQEYLSLSRALAYRLIQTREIPSYKIGRCVRVRRADVEAYLDTCRR